MKTQNLNSKSSKLLQECSKEDLIWFISVIEEKYNLQSSNLKEVSSNLQKAQSKIVVQHEQLIHLRKIIVELTPGL